MTTLFETLAVGVDVWVERKRFIETTIPQLLRLAEVSITNFDCLFVHPLEPQWAWQVSARDGKVDVAFVTYWMAPKGDTLYATHGRLQRGVHRQLPLNEVPRVWKTLDFFIEKLFDLHPELKRTTAFLVDAAQEIVAKTSKV